MKLDLKEILRIQNRLREIKIEINGGYLIDPAAELERFEALRLEHSILKKKLNFLYGQTE